MEGFLVAHPTETLVMRLGGAGGPYDPVGSKTNFAKDICGALQPYTSFFYHGSSQDPTLDSIRGKIVVLADFTDTTNSSSPCDLANVTTMLPFATGEPATQDHYIIDPYDPHNGIATKMYSHIRPQLLAAYEAPASSPTIYSNYLSGTGPQFFGPIEVPPAASAVPYFFAGGCSLADCNFSNIEFGAAFMGRVDHSFLGKIASPIFGYCLDSPDCHVGEDGIELKQGSGPGWYTSNGGEFYFHGENPIATGVILHDILCVPPADTSECSQHANVSGHGIGLIFTDYPGPKLIDTIINVNPVATPVSVRTVNITEPSGTPTITVTGSGFGTQASLGQALAPCAQATTGDDGKNYINNLYLTDTTRNWTAGQFALLGTCDEVGLKVVSYSDTQIVATLGSSFSKLGVVPAVGDSFTMHVLGISFSGQVVFPKPIITGVAFTGTPAAPTVFVVGSGFGAQTSIGTPQTPCAQSTTGDTGKNYGNNFYLSDTTKGWNAGQGNIGPCDEVGLVISAYTNTSITFQPGSAFTQFASLAGGDEYSIHLFGAQVSGIASFGTAKPMVSSVTFGGSSAAPTVTITGSGFGTKAVNLDPFQEAPGGPASTGFNYHSQLYIGDTARGWVVGQTGDYFGILISSYSDSQIVFTLGSGYQAGLLKAGDAVSLHVLGVQVGDSVTYPPAISWVGFTGSAANPTVIVLGSGFGTQANLGVPQSPGVSGWTGSDYGNNLWLSDVTNGWNAGQNGDTVGLVVSSYSDTRIVFTFGSQYPAGYKPLTDSPRLGLPNIVALHVLGTSVTQAAHYASIFSVSFSGTTAQPIVTVSGSWIGPQAALGSDISKSLYFADGSQGVTFGNPANYMGSHYGALDLINGNNPQPPVALLTYNHASSIDTMSFYVPVTNTSNPSATSQYDNVNINHYGTGACDTYVLFVQGVEATGYIPIYSSGSAPTPCVGDAAAPAAAIVTNPIAAPALPRTGQNTMPLVLLGLCSVLVGSMTIRLTRRRGARRVTSTAPGGRGPI